MTMIKALVGSVQTYQTGAWPGIEEFGNVRPVIAVPDGDGIARVL